MHDGHPMHCTLYRRLVSIDLTHLASRDAAARYCTYCVHSHHNRVNTSTFPDQKLQGADTDVVYACMHTVVRSHPQCLPINTSEQVRYHNGGTEQSMHISSLHLTSGNHAPDIVASQTWHIPIREGTTTDSNVDLS